MHAAVYTGTVNFKMIYKVDANPSIALLIVWYITCSTRSALQYSQVIEIFDMFIISSDPHRNNFFLTLEFWTLRCKSGKWVEFVSSSLLDLSKII